MKKILCEIPSLFDATSFYRAMIPMGELRRCHPDKIDLCFEPQYSYQFLSQFDLLFIQRPNLPKSVDLIEMAKQAGLKVWVDYDDLLTHVPTCNPSYFQYSFDKNINSLKSCLQLADVVSVSTEHLAQKYFQYSQNIKVIPNAFPDRLLKEFKNPLELPARDNVIAWRGSHTHQKDIYQIAEKIIYLSEKINSHWLFFGDTCWMVTDYMPRNKYTIIPPTDIRNYLNNIQKYNIKTFIVPLEDTDFNRSKSNINFIEATFAGSLTLSSALPEFENPHCINFTTANEFETAIIEIMKMDYEGHRRAHSLAWEYVCDNYMLSKTNVLRIRLLEELWS